MSRSITEIYDAIITEKQQVAELSDLQPAIDSSQALLSDLTSSSKVSTWRLYLFLFSTAVWVHEQLFDQHKKEIEEKVKDAVNGNIRWYWLQCFLFQLGDSLQFINKKYQYPSVNPANQIIKRASVFEAGSQVIMKVAKLDGANIPTPLSSIELTAFNNYINQIKIAGTSIVVISTEADEIVIKYEVTVNQQVLSLNGESISSPGTYPVVDKINSYIQNLDFDGILNFTELTDEIQKINGVIDPVFQTASAKYGALAFQPILTNQYRPNAGYLKTSVADPISTTITYI